MATRKKSALRSSNFQGVIVLSVIITIGVFVLINNDQPPQFVLRPVAVLPTQSKEPEWRSALEYQLENAATAAPTQPLPPTVEFIPPTLPIDPSATPRIVQVTQIQPTLFPTTTPLPTNPFTYLTPTIAFRGATPIPSPTGATLDDAGGAVAQYEPPAESVPLSLQPNDHFFMRRPVDASANGESLFYYPYGSTGQVSRVHHGIDIPNPVGERVLAASGGTVVWADRSLQDIKEGTLEIYASYGNVVVIQHDFSFQGQPVWTLYAHLSAILVSKGQRVEIGDTIGLVGDTGFVTGAHVHFEVRVGVNSYWSTRNPLLWMAPYLNHGVVAGRVVDGQGVFIDNVIVQINRGGRRVDSTVTYTQPQQADVARWHVVPDENWGETFVLGDVPAGDYQVVALIENQRYTANLTVRAGMVNWIEFQVNPPAATPLPPQDTEGTEGS
jgi:murein DD-endopeptidase MepM/ murein hydrolase activator NlpD